MGKEIIDKVDQYIQAIAEALGVAAEHVYSVLVKQQIIAGSVKLGIGLLLLTLLILTIKWSINIYTKAKFEDRWTPLNIWAKIQRSDFVGDGYVWIIGGFVWLTLILISLPLTSSGVLNLLNPEYYAIKEILGVFSN